ncbi:MAG: polysaccharide biosynthesis/export family protein [Planctomycetota bacterium]
MTVSRHWHPSPLSRKTAGPRQHLRAAALLPTAALAFAGVALTGCEADSYLDPSNVGRWEPTPVTVPILERVASIESSATDVDVSPVTEADLIPDKVEYIFSEGDQVQITIFEFLAAGQDSVFQRRVDSTGQVRLPNLGAITVAGLSPSQLEQDLVDRLSTQNILNNAQVTVTALTRQEATYSILGQPDEDGVRFGTYIIPRPNFRLLDAIATAGGIPGQVKRLRVVRRVVIDERVRGVEPGVDPSQEDSGTEAAPADGRGVVEELEDALDGGALPDAGDNRGAPPSGLELQDRPRSGFVVVDGEFVQTGEPTSTPRVGASDDSFANQLEELEGLDRLVTQRIIEVPYERLRRGDLRFDIVIRPGDIITVPERSAGFVYIMGATARPGAYSVPGENELTLKQLIAASGGLAGGAFPSRVDLVRRTAPNQESTVRLDLRAIFNGTEPDLFLKPNDLINIGTSFTATPLAVFRNGLRATYGFGFIVDRNFANQVFGNQ